jgi:hypothetical protein
MKYQLRRSFLKIRKQRDRKYGRLVTLPARYYVEDTFTRTVRSYMVSTLAEAQTVLKSLKEDDEYRGRVALS